MLSRRRDMDHTPHLELRARRPFGIVERGRHFWYDIAMQLEVQRIHDDAVLPAYAHPGDAGMDLCACESVTLAPGETRSVGTGLILALPPGTEGQIRPRSGLAMRHGITLLNSPGTLDAGYRGEVRILMINHGRGTFRVVPGMRIAQLVVAPVLRLDVRAVSSHTGTARGAGGFGSTGLGSAQP